VGIFGEFVSDAASWAKGAAKDVGKTANDGWDWAEDAADDAAKWSKKSAEDAWGAGEIAFHETKGFATDKGGKVVGWGETAAGDVVEWTETTAKDIEDWSEIAAGDVADFSEAAFKVAYEGIQKLGAMVLDDLQTSLPKLGDYNASARDLAVTIFSETLVEELEQGATTDGRTMAVGPLLDAQAGVSFSAEAGIYVDDQGKWGFFSGYDFGTTASTEASVSAAIRIIMVWGSRADFDQQVVPLDGDFKAASVSMLLRTSDSPWKVLGFTFSLGLSFPKGKSDKGKDQPDKKKGGEKPELLAAARQDVVDSRADAVSTQAAAFAAKSRDPERIKATAIAAAASGHVDAAVQWKPGKAYFFHGKQYVRYSMIKDRVDPGYPRIIDTGWDGLHDKLGGDIQAAVKWDDERVYFFRGENYCRYSISSDVVDRGPTNIDRQWDGLRSKLGGDIEAAIKWNGRLYFFRGDRYCRYKFEDDKVDRGPTKIDPNWDGLLSKLGSRIRGAIEWGRSKAYFFGDGKYVRVSGDKCTDARSTRRGFMGV
jgi:Hemopexin